MHPGRRALSCCIPVWWAVCLGILMLSLFAVPLVGEEAEEPILAPSLVADLRSRCDPDEIYEKAWEGTLQGLSPEDVDTFDFGRLGAEVMQILASCFERELAAFDCDKMTCDDFDEGIKRLKGLHTKYFLFAGDDRFLAIDTSSLFPSARCQAWNDYQEKLEACYRSVFESCSCEVIWRRWENNVLVSSGTCECDLERLHALWIDLVLDVVNPFEGRMEMAEKVLAEYEECLVEKIASMTDVEAMLDLILERDEETWFRYRGARGDTLYNNYTVACAILKRIVELFNMNEDDIERYLCSPCCDTVWLLHQIAESMRLHYIWRCPETGWREGTGCDPSGAWAFREAFELRGGLYPFCRSHQLDNLAADCDPNAFCQLLACREYGVASYRESLEAQLADPREEEFLKAFKRRLEECLGEEVDLQDVIDWCVRVPANKTWDALRSAGEGDSSATTIQIGPITIGQVPDLEPESGPTVTPAVPATPISVPEDIANSARILAWKGGQLGRTDPSQRWSADEFNPGEFCEPCGHTPMCEVCMEWDLQQWQQSRQIALTDMFALMTVLTYLEQVSGQPEYQALASVYWDAHWDGLHDRNRPW
jgi:hypothetical protein